METFLEVRDRLNKPETRLEYNLCFKKPWRFYKEHTVDDAVDLIKKEIETKKGEFGNAQNI